MEQQGIINAVLKILKNKKLLMRLLIALAVIGLVAWLALAPKDIPTPWGTCHQGPVIPAKTSGGIAR